MRTLGPVLLLVFCSLFVAVRAEIRAEATPKLPVISGVFAGEDSAELAGRRVTLLPLPPNYQWHRGVLSGQVAPEAVATVAAETSRRFTIAAPSAGMWSLVVTAPGRVPMRYTPLPVTEDVELPPVELVPDSGIEVVVRRRGGEPVEGAWVLLTTNSPRLWRQERADGWQVGSRIARTDGMGRVVMARRADEALQAHLFFSAARVQVPIGGDEVRAELTLELSTAMRPAEVRLHDAPAADVVVTAGRPAWPFAKTGKDGGLDVPTALEGPFRFLFPNGQTHEVEVLPSATLATPIVVELEAARRLGGKVLDGATGRPLAGALVWPGDDPGALAISGADGAYRFFSSPQPRAWVQIEARGFQPQAVRLPQMASMARIPTVTLEPSRTLDGRVVDAEGAPLDGAIVTADRKGQRRYEVFQRDRADSRAVSGIDGRFLLLRLEPSAIYEFEVSRSGYRTVRTSSPAEPLRLVLAPARAAHGSVVDGQEQPLQGVEVTIRPSANADGAGGEPVTAETDAQGRFRVFPLPADRVDLEAHGNGLAPLVVPGVAVAPGSGVVDLGVLTMVPGAEITGRVTDVEERPLAGVEIWWTETLGPTRPGLGRTLRLQEPAAVTDTTGRFTLSDLAPDPIVSLLLARRGYLPEWVPGITAPPVEPLTVVLRKATSLSGRVEMADTGEAVPGARVRLTPAPPPPGTVGVKVSRHADAAETQTESDGLFTFSEVAPGEVLLEARAAGFVQGEPFEVQVPPDGERNGIRLVLGRGAQLGGWITNTEGEPVSAARVRVGAARSKSDAEGRYDLAGVRPGLRALVVTHPSYRRQVREVEVEPGINRADVSVERGRKISGRVLDGEGRAKPGATVTLRNRNERGPRSFQSRSTTDGLFEILGVVDGEFDLEVTAEGFAPTCYQHVVEVAGNDIEGLELELQLGATVLGRVRGVEIEEMAGVRVTAEAGGRRPRSSTVDFQGRYEISNLEAGNWRFRARLQGGRREVEKWVLITEIDHELERDLVLGEGLVLDGRVLFEDRPLAVAQVNVRGLNLTLDRYVTTDYRGAFRLEDLEPGHYRVEVVHAERMLSQSQDLELVADREIVIEITPATLSGRVVSAETGEGVADALVYLQRQIDGREPGPLTTVGTDGDGGFVTASLAPGLYRLTVRATGYTPVERRVTLAAGDVAGPEILQLEATAGLWLDIRRAVGPPPAHATIVVLDLDGRKIHFEDVRLSDYGRAYLGQIPTGTWNLLIRAAGSATALTQATVPSDSLEVILPPGAPLTVRVPELLESRAAAFLTITTVDGAPHIGVAPGGYLQQTWPLIGGTATVADLPGGVWHLQVAAADGRTWSSSAATAGEEALTVEIP